MTIPRTKIQPPQPRPGSLLPRPALEARLHEALLSRRLVLLCAPAGYGKTSLLARQLQTLPPGTATAWVSCDDGDSPARLFEALVAALEPWDVPWRTAPEALVRTTAEATTPARRRAIATELINALDACEVPHGVVVVDDLHRIADPLVHEFFDHVLERLTPRWTLAATARVEPPLALARLRVQGDVADLRVDDLRFDRDEARALAAAAGIADSAADRLHDRCQGWPVGLRLGLDTLRRSGGSGATSGLAPGQIDRQAMDFLASEVIGRLDPAQRDFLLACSVLPELTAGRCAAVTGDAMSAQRLEDIERAGLFVTALDSSEPTLRLHDLFRDALQARLAREQPERLPLLLRRAADTEPDLVRRVTWLQRAGDWEQAERVLAEAADTLVTTGQAAVLADMLQRFPPGQLERSAGLQMARTVLAWTRWDWETALDATQRAVDAFRRDGDEAAARMALSYHAIVLAGANRAESVTVARSLLDDPATEGATRCRALLACCWHDLRGGDQRRIAPQFSQLLDVLETLPQLPRWYECSPVPPMVGLPAMRAPLQRYIGGALRRLPDHPTPLRGVCQVIQGWLHLWVGDVAAAQASVDAAASDAAWLARPVNVHTYATGLQAMLLALHGQGSAAMAAMQGLIDELLAQGEPLRVRVYLGFFHFQAMRCAAVAGDDAARLAAAAQRVLAQREAGTGWLSPQQMDSARAHLADATGDLDEASARWRALLAQEAHADIYGQMTEARLRLADALWRRERPPPEAAAVLLPLFERLDASGEWGAVLMAGSAVLQRLADRDWGPALGDARVAQLRRWAAQAQALRAPAPPAATRGIAWSGSAWQALGQPGRAADAASAGMAGRWEETALAAASRGAAGVDRGGTAPIALPQLSARETEVLARIAAGDSNKLIARAFDLSPHTVKRHVANILDKLALSSRGQAAAWYRDHR